MKKLKIFILLGIMILGVILLTGCTEGTYNSTEQNGIENQIIQECEHDWVVTSEYSWIFESYRTVSKCSKCGKVVR